MVWGSNPRRGKRFFISPKRPDWLCGPPGLLFSRVLSWGWSSWDMKLSTHLHLVLTLRMSGALLLLPLYACMSWTGRTLPLLVHVLCPALFIHHLNHWIVAVTLLKCVYDLQDESVFLFLVVTLLFHKLHDPVVIGMIIENSCSSLIWKSEGLDDDSCNRIVSVLLINRF